MAKFLRFLGILFLGISAALTLLSGVGTTCAALNPTGYDSMVNLAPYQALYIVYVLTAVGLGIWGIKATIQLTRGKAGSTRTALVVLSANVLSGGIHMLTSRLLRGSSLPLDFIVYFSGFTLLLFLIYRIPGIREKVDFESSGGNERKAAGGLTALVSGLCFLTVQMWASPDHQLHGINYADAFRPGMTLGGVLLILIGLGWIASSSLSGLHQTRHTAQNL